MTFDQTHRSEFYFEYHRIGTKAFRDKVRFYEDNKNHLKTLNYEERIEVDLDYALCLFEIGKYHKFLSQADPLIEVVIIDNIFSFNGVNIYNDLLFKKAACLYNTGQYIKSEKILKSLIHLDAENTIARTLYAKCKRKQGRKWHDGAKATAVFFFLSAVLISVVELLMIKPFHTDYLSIISNIKFVSFGIGILILIGNELYLRHIIGREIGYRFDVKEFKNRIRS